MTENGSHLVSLVARHAVAEGISDTAWPGLRMLRASRPSRRMPVVSEPYLCVVAQGRKRTHVGGEAYVYDPLHYLVLAIPMPIEGEIVEASPEKPFLSLSLAIDLPAVSELLLEMGDDGGRKPRSARRGVYVSCLRDGLASAVGRLLACLDDPAERRILGPLAEREVLYRLLAGEQGDLLRSVALRDSRSHQIARVLRYVQSHYAEPLDVSTLADVARMSSSSLHHNFKKVTSESPLQYLKKIRLHRARLMMLHDGMSAGEAAHRVGYGSPSQFSREFKRLFGAPPGRDVERLRAAG